MKTLTTFLITISFIAVSAAADIREFTSADGTKTLKAKVLDYSQDKGVVKMLRVDGKAMTFPVKALSKEDGEYLKVWYQSTMAGRKLAVRITDEEKKISEKKTENARVSSYNSNFKFNVRNNGTSPFENIEVKYQIFYMVDGVKGTKNQDLVASGQTNISSIFPRTDQNLTTEKVNLTKIRPLPASQCTGGTCPNTKVSRASSRTDRVKGIIAKFFKDGEEFKEVVYPSGFRGQWSSGNISAGL